MAEFLIIRSQSAMATRPTRRKKTLSRPRDGADLRKAPTGIDGFDEITGGGVPEGRPTLVCGGPGCGKTLFGLAFLAHGATIGEPGLFVTFEETEHDLIENVRSLGYDLNKLIRRKRVAIEYIRVER